MTHREDVRRAVRRARGAGPGPPARLGNGRRTGRRGARAGQETARGGRRGVAGGRARVRRGAGRGDLTAAVPGPGDHARPRAAPRRRLPPPVGSLRTMLRVAVPNKGTLAAPASEILTEAGY